MAAIYDDVFRPEQQIGMQPLGEPKMGAVGACRLGIGGSLFMPCRRIILRGILGWFSGSLRG